MSRVFAPLKCTAADATVFQKVVNLAQISASTIRDGKLFFRLRIDNHVPQKKIKTKVIQNGRGDE